MTKSFKIILFVLAVSISQLSTAQVIKGKKIDNSKAYTVKVSDLESRVDDSPSANIRVPNKNWEVPQWTFDKSRIIYEEAVGSYKKPLNTRETSPAPDTTFLALADNGSSIPPDVNGTVGLDNIMVTLNTQVRIQDREGNDLMTTSLSNFWNDLPGNGGTFDPKIIYDPYNDRWIMTTPSGSNSNDSKLYLGVSLTSDPMGEWYMYWIDPDESNTTWFDYPSIGFNKKWITISGNMFGNDYYRTVFTFDKMAAYNGEEDLNVTRFATYQGFTLVPSITYDTIVEDQYLISTSSGNNGGMGYIQKFKLDGPVDNPVFEYEGAIGIPEPWANGAGNSGNFLPQLGSSELINSVDSRMENVIYRNGKLWAVHHIFLPANNPKRTAVQWWNLDTDGIILERGRIEDPTSDYSFAFPTIAVNKNEDLFIGFDVFSENQYASAAYAYKSHYDEPNSMREYYQYKDGLAPYYKTFGGGRNRWGDYSNTSVDPRNDIDFWTIQEYASTDNKWGTWWAYMRPSFQPETDFQADNILIPTGGTVDFNDQTIGVPSSWEWTFSGAAPSVSNEQNPNDIVYDSEGSYDVKLISSNIYGSDTLLKEDYITSSSTILPEVDFEVNETIVCTGSEVFFRDKSNYSPIEWEWQFNPSTVTFVNGTNENSQNPVVIFDEAGSYALTLKVWNLNGASESTSFDLIKAGGYSPYFNEDFEQGLKLRSWMVENPDNDITWELADVAGQGHGQKAVSINFHEYFAFTQRDRLISPAYNLENMSNAVLEFEHAYAKKYAQVTDSLIILISEDCGASWTSVMRLGDDNNGSLATSEATTTGFVPQNVDDWCGAGFGSDCFSIDLNAYTNKANIKIAFESYNANGNQLYIDNMKISQFVGVDESSLSQEDLVVFPNPTSSAFSVRINDNAEYQKIQLINHIGQVIFQEDISGSINSFEFNTNSKLKAGIYFIRLSGSSNTVSNKVVIL